MFDDSEIEGFYKDTFIDITEQVVPNSLKRNFEKTVFQKIRGSVLHQHPKKGLFLDIPRAKIIKSFDGFKND